MGKPIFFFGKDEPYFELSNFAPFGFVEDGVSWPTVEHYFQAQKFPDPEHADYRERIRTAGSPQHAKTLRQTRDVPIRPDWDDVKEAIMRKALRQKFANAALRKLLVGTGKRLLIENSPYDRYWGCGRNGKGKNRLGVLLMELREELRSEK